LASINYYHKKPEALTASGFSFAYSFYYFQSGSIPYTLLKVAVFCLQLVLCYLFESGIVGFIV